MPALALVRWRAALSRRGFVPKLAGSIVAVLIVLASAATLLPRNEIRAGAVLRDPILELLPSADLTVPLMIGTYGVIALALAVLCAAPERLVLGLQAYALLLLMRLTGIWLVALDPPQGMIPLHDPFVGMATGGTTLAKDLFFSGHVATLSLCGWAVEARPVRWLCFASAVAVGLGLLIQHAHYTVDVAAAPFFAYLALTLVRRMN
jgi:hypothetical protein